MKSKYILIILTILVVSSACIRADTGYLPATRTTIGVSPYYSPTDGKRVRDALLNFVLSQSPPGNSIDLCDAFNLETIASINVPNVAAKYDSAASRARMLQQPLANLVRWFNQQMSATQPEEFRGSAAVRTVEWLDQMSSAPSQSHIVLVIGNPLRIDPREPAFNMTPDLIPSDGHLVALPEQSLFSITGKTNRLQGSLVHWTYLSESVWANELHAQRVRRFWCLWFGLQSGSLASFSPDLNSVLALVPRKGVPPIGHFQIDTNDTKVMMLTAVPREVPRWLPQATGETNGPTRTNMPPSGKSTAAPEKPAASRQAPARSPAATVAPAVVTQLPAWNLAQTINSPLFVGVAWESADAALDVDLYVKPFPDAAELSFQRVRTPQGYYVYDWRQPNSRRDYEWVCLQPPVRLDQTTIWLNLFKGHGPISGTVAVHFDNKTYSGGFHIAASRGNGGAHATVRRFSPSWTHVDLAQVMQHGRMQ